MWRGIVYTVLMALAKVMTGVWLVRFIFPLPKALNLLSLSWMPKWCYCKTNKPKSNMREPRHKAGSTRSHAEVGDKTNTICATGHQQQDVRHESRIDRAQEATIDMVQPRVKRSKPLSLYPASLIGTAMVSRGEIGFLIASVAESKGIFAHTSPPMTAARAGGSEIFLVVIWAVIVCTIIGPVAVGTLTKRLQKLQTAEREKPSGIDPLGVWGVI